MLRKRRELFLQPNTLWAISSLGKQRVLLRIRPDSRVLIATKHPSTQYCIMFESTSFHTNHKTSDFKRMGRNSGILPNLGFWRSQSAPAKCVSLIHYDKWPNLVVVQRLSPSTFKNIEKVMKKTKSVHLRAHQFDFALFLALTWPRYPDPT